VRVTDRGWTVITWIVIVILVVAVIATSLMTPEPCEGKEGDAYQLCVDLNYP
jgi:hypothetical protein